ncbi:MAG: TetR/AcrR family transcriptional regulator [Mailhella sp.]|nr:TetR/AcrR family transcriptional regulator [Mailhella sp.]
MRSSLQGKGRPRAFDRNEALEKALEVFWRQGYEPASVAALCSAMGINAPSLYASFGNKSALFIEALDYYEQAYWSKPAERFLGEPDIARAVENFFLEAAEILLSPDTPCGCMVVLAAINISSEAREVSEAVRRLRFATKKMFADRLQRAVLDGQLAADADIPALAGALNAFLEGLSIQARDGILQAELKAMASHALRLLPSPEAR